MIIIIYDNLLICLFSYYVGANKGIGFEIAKKLSISNIKTIIACRNIELGLQAKEELNKLTTGDVEFRQLDIGDIHSCDEFTEGIKRDYGKIDILINNAAIAFKGSGIFIYLHILSGLE